MWKGTDDRVMPWSGRGGIGDGQPQHAETDKGRRGGIRRDRKVIKSRPIPPESIPSSLTITIHFNHQIHSSSKLFKQTLQANPLLARLTPPPHKHIQNAVHQVHRCHPLHPPRLRFGGCYPRHSRWCYGKQRHVRSKPGDPLLRHRDDERGQWFPRPWRSFAQRCLHQCGRCYWSHSW